MDKTIELNPNAVVSFLRKRPEAFTREDMIRFIVENNIRMIDFMYPAEDGRIKTLNFNINSLAYAETILSEGERVDGSSLFPSFIEAGNSDLYVVPRYRTAFVDPFTEIPTLCFLCIHYKVYRIVESSQQPSARLQDPIAFSPDRFHKAHIAV